MAGMRVAYIQAHIKKVQAASATTGAKRARWNMAQGYSAGGLLAWLLCAAYADRQLGGQHQLRDLGRRTNARGRPRGTEPAVDVELTPLAMVVPAHESVAQHQLGGIDEQRDLSAVRVSAQGEVRMRAGGRKVAGIVAQ